MAFSVTRNILMSLKKSSTSSRWLSGLVGKAPRSCDTFVALPPSTEHGYVIFGKNSDRPSEEVQELVHMPASDHGAGSTVQCTYIEIDQVAHTNAVVLSKPSWMWGAEMGANEHGVCIGNEAVWTQMLGDHDSEERLLGMDLVRLGLERSTSAKSAVDTLVGLLDKHGQGGGCAEGDPSFLYHNSFLVADRCEAWVLETAYDKWAAERVTCGTRNISNQLTIRTKIDMMSPGLKEHAQSQGWWSPSDGDFDFARAYSCSFEDTELGPDERPSGRQLWGTKLLRDYSAKGQFGPRDMMKILRHEPSGICMTGGYTSTGSQVSVLPPGETPCIHWLTGTPKPHHSLFKPFLFCDNSSVGKASSPDLGDKDPRKMTPRFQTEVDRRHPLWAAHEMLDDLLDRDNPKGHAILQQMHEMESHCIQDMADLQSMPFDPHTNGPKVAQIFEHMVELEMNFYK